MTRLTTTAFTSSAADSTVVNGERVGLAGVGRPSLPKATRDDDVSLCDVTRQTADCDVEYTSRVDNSMEEVLIPVPQNDGPDPVVRIKYTPEFEDAMGRFRAILLRDELSERALAVTGDVIDANAANYTAWAYRRRCLEAIGSRDTWLRELEWSAEVTRANQKNYQVWFHRRRCVDVLGAGDASELAFIAECLEEDAKNYHAWGYRQWLIRRFGLWGDELTYAAQLLADDPFNNSAWNQRFFVLRGTGALAEAAAVSSELELAMRELRHDPANVAPWNYAKGLVEAGPDTNNAGWLAARCREVLSSHPGCVPAAATLVDMCEREREQGGGNALVEEALALCNALATKWDTIRSKYWAMRHAQLSVPPAPGAMPTALPAAVSTARAQ